LSPHRFEIGTQVMCNFGQHGWKLGRIVALDYREDAWPEDRVAPYQVMLDGSYALIYVPKDNDRVLPQGNGGRRPDPRPHRRARQP